MDLSALKNAARGITIPATPDLSPFDERQRQALRPVVEAMDGLGRLVEGIRNLPDATAVPSWTVWPTQTKVLGTEPESTAQLLPEEGVTVYGVRRGKVLAVYNEAGAAYTDYETDGFIHFVLVAPQLPGSTDFSEEEEDRLYIKATEIGGAATELPAVGYVSIAVDDEIGYVMGGLLEQVPGLAPFFPFDGQLYGNAGAGGGRFAAAYEVFGGPGIKVEDVVDNNQNKVLVELATSPGLEFDAAGDAGKLRVKPDTSKGIDVGASGVRVDLATVPGLLFSSGDLAVKPNAAKAIIVETAGVGVVANAAKAIAVDASGVAVVPNEAKGIAVDANGVQLKILDGIEGLEWDAGTLRTKPDTTKAINYSADGLCLVLDTTHLEFNAGSLRHKLQGQNVTKIAIYEDGGNLATRVWKGGVEIPSSPNNNVIMEFDTAGQITDASYG